MAKSRAGRNRDKCKAYRANGTREANKKRKADKRANKLLKRALKRAEKEAA